ncbi:hypothetical protein H9P43_006662 [Blastocladiella emersonii ATCC 22665]|nr:hypothetical protein H9P43_006662 [Blastocladiella emersonii ATCC 22665]
MRTPSLESARAIVNALVAHAGSPVLWRTPNDPAPVESASILAFLAPSGPLDITLANLLVRAAFQDVDAASGARLLVAPVNLFARAFTDFRLLRAQGNGDTAAHHAVRLADWVVDHLTDTHDLIVFPCLRGITLISIRRRDTGAPTCSIFHAGRDDGTDADAFLGLFAGKLTVGGTKPVIHVVDARRDWDGATAHGFFRAVLGVFRDAATVYAALDEGKDPLVRDLAWPAVGEEAARVEAFCAAVPYFLEFAERDAKLDGALVFEINTFRSTIRWQLGVSPPCKRASVPDDDDPRYCRAGKRIRVNQHLSSRANGHARGNGDAPDGDTRDTRDSDMRDVAAAAEPVPAPPPPPPPILAQFDHPRFIEFTANAAAPQPDTAPPPPPVERLVRRFLDTDGPTEIRAWRNNGERATRLFMRDELGRACIGTLAPIEDDGVGIAWETVVAVSETQPDIDPRPTQQLTFNGTSDRSPDAVGGLPCVTQTAVPETPSAVRAAGPVTRKTPKKSTRVLETRVRSTSAAPTLISVVPPTNSGAQLQQMLPPSTPAAPPAHPTPNGSRALVVPAHHSPSARGALLAPRYLPAQQPASPGNTTATAAAAQPRSHAASGGAATSRDRTVSLPAAVHDLYAPNFLTASLPTSNPATGRPTAANGGPQSPAHGHPKPASAAARHQQQQQQYLASPPHTTTTTPAATPRLGTIPQPAGVSAAHHPPPTPLTAAAASVNSRSVSSIAVPNELPTPSSPSGWHNALLGDLAARYPPAHWTNGQHVRVAVSGALRHPSAAPGPANRAVEASRKDGPAQPPAPRSPATETRPAPVSDADVPPPDQTAANGSADLEAAARSAASLSPRPAGPAAKSRNAEPLDKRATSHDAASAESVALDAAAATSAVDSGLTADGVRRLDAAGGGSGSAPPASLTEQGEAPVLEPHGTADSTPTSEPPQSHRPPSDAASAKANMTAAAELAAADAARLMCLHPTSHPSAPRSVLMTLTVLRALERIFADAVRRRQFAELLCGFSDTSGLDLTPLLYTPRSVDEYKAVWAVVGTATGATMKSQFSDGIAIRAMIAAMHRLIVVLACVADHLPAALGVDAVDVPAGIGKPQVMLAVNRLQRTDWTRVLAWFAANVSPVGLTELAAGHSHTAAAGDAEPAAAPAPRGTRFTLADLRLALDSHPLAMFLPMLMRHRVRVAFPECAAAGSVAGPARNGVSRAAFRIAFADPVFATRAIDATRAVAVTPGLVPAVRVVLELACANVASSSVLALVDGRIALVHAGTPGQEDGTGAAGLVERVRRVGGRLTLAPGVVQLRGWDEFVTQHADALDVLAAGGKVKPEPELEVEVELDEVGEAGAAEASVEQQQQQLEVAAAE